MPEKKKAFGGYTINFKGQGISMETLFGSKSISPAEMNKTLWAHVKTHKLASKGK